MPFPTQEARKVELFQVVAGDQLGHSPAFTRHERLEDASKLRILDVMGGVRRGRRKATHSFVLTTSARVERSQPLADGLIDPVVVADVEVEEREVDSRAPVAAVQDLALLH